MAYASDHTATGTGYSETVNRLNVYVNSFTILATILIYFCPDLVLNPNASSRHCPRLLTFITDGWLGGRGGGVHIVHHARTLLITIVQNNISPFSISTVLSERLIEWGPGGSKVTRSARALLSTTAAVQDNISLRSMCVCDSGAELCCREWSVIGEYLIVRSVG
jgi:hypothetical protein